MTILISYLFRRRQPHYLGLLIWYSKCINCWARCTRHCINEPSVHRSAKANVNKIPSRGVNRLSKESGSFVWQTMQVRKTDSLDRSGGFFSAQPFSCSSRRTSLSVARIEGWVGRWNGSGNECEIFGLLLQVVYISIYEHMSKCMWRRKTVYILYN